MTTMTCKLRGTDNTAGDDVDGARMDTLFIFSPIIIGLQTNNDELGFHSPLSPLASEPSGDRGFSPNGDCGNVAVAVQPVFFF